MKESRKPGKYVGMGAGLGISLGASFGVIYGIMMEDVGFWIAIGVGLGITFGVGIGTRLDAKVKNKKWKYSNHINVKNAKWLLQKRLDCYDITKKLINQNQNITNRNGIGITHRVKMKTNLV